MTNLVEVAAFYDPEEAYCAQAYLRSCGIETLLQNEHHLTMAPWLRVALGGYRLLAPSSSKDGARDALRHVHGKENKTQQGDGTSPLDQVPKESAPYLRRRNWLWLPIAFGSAAPFIPVYKSKTELFIQLLLLIPWYGMVFYFWIDWGWYLLRNQ